MKLLCKLKKHVITADHDFIPCGSPVQVLQWDESGNKITCQTVVHVYCDRVDDESQAGEGFIGEGLYIDVLPEDLEYFDYW